MSMLRSLGVSALAVLPLVVACSGGSTTTGGSGSVVSCRQKAGSDTDKSCSAMTGRPRKLDCDDGTQTDAALAAGCVREKPGDSDVCCPLGVSGTGPTTGGATVACEQKAGADGDKDCVEQPTNHRKLDCDSDQTASAIAAGCVRINPTGSDVCCPATVSGQPPGATTDGGTTAKPQSTVQITLSAGGAGCAGDVFKVGSFAPPTPVVDGSGATSVACTVSSTGSSFSVDAKVTTSDGASFSINGTANATASGASLTGVYTDAAGTAYPRSGCTMTYPSEGGVASGRFWATLTCAPKGGTVPDSCIITSQVKLENCTQ